MSLWTEVITGRSAVVNGFSTMGRLQLNRLATSEPIFASNLDGGAERADGNLNFEGVIAAWGHTPPTFPNSTFALSFTLDGSNKTVASNVMCTGLDVFVPTFDPRGQNCIYYHVLFGPVGADLLDSGSPAPTDATDPAKYATYGLDLFLDEAPQGHIDNMRLQIRSLAEARPDSSTAGIYVTPLGNIDWKLTYRQNIYAMSQLPDRNDIYETWMQVVGGEEPLYWKLKYGRVLDHKIDVDHESNQIIGADVTLAKCGWTDELGAYHVGSIIDPAESTKWP